MSKHMRFVVTILFAVILLLTASITKFYSDTGKSPGGDSAGTDVKKKLGSDSQGNRIFEDSSGLFGVIDSNERVIINPEWLELSFTGDNLCTVSKRINGKLLTGCIDYEGNVVIPMIYREIKKHSRGSFVFYTAYPAADSSCVLYDETFSPLFTRSWESCSITEDKLELTGIREKYTYSIDYNGLSLKKAELSGAAFDCGYELKSSSINLLSLLDKDMLEKICDATGKYIEYAFTGSREYLSGIRTGEKSVFTTIFPEDKQILSKKLTGLSNIVIYMVNSNDELPHYAVSLRAEAEIAYTDENDNPQTLNGSYKAVIEFCGSSGDDLEAVSGRFIQNSPNYPKVPVKTQDNKEQNNQTPGGTESQAGNV